MNPNMPLWLNVLGAFTLFAVWLLIVRIGATYAAAHRCYCRRRFRAFLRVDHPRNAVLAARVAVTGVYATLVAYMLGADHAWAWYVVTGWLTVAWCLHARHAATRRLRALVP